MSNLWLKVSGVAGVSAIALSAIGAHMIEKKSDSSKNAWKTASMYHLIHSVVLTLGATQFHGRKRNIVCGLLATGIIMFPGTLYTNAYMEPNKFFINVAPVGAIVLMMGWAAIGFL